MSQPHKTYRVYCYDGVHKVVSVDLIDAASDEEAVDKAESMGFGSKCEVWDEHRLVAQLAEQQRLA